MEGQQQVLKAAGLLRTERLRMNLADINKHELKCTVKERAGIEMRGRKS